jgi:putative transcription factor
MECEICGTDIKGNSIRVIVEGTVLDVCSKCAHYGKPQDKWTPVSRKMAPTERVIVTHRPKRDAFDKLEDEILPDYAQVIKKARESQGLTIEDLASKMMEKATLIRKIEREELVPEDTVRKKLETTLNIKLTERVSSQDQRGGGFIRGTTLGDVAIIRKKGK